MTSLDISDNRLCGYWKTPDFSGYQALVAAIEAHKLLTMDAVNMAEELDVSGQNLGVKGAKTMAIFIQNNGAMAKLDIANNSIGVNGLKALAEALQDNKTLTELNVASNNVTNAMDSTGNTSMSGVGALANAIPTIGALTSLNVSNNRIGYRGNMSGVEALAAAIPECR